MLSILFSSPLQAGIKIKNPYRNGGFWYVGNLHAHSNNSGGLQSPQELEADYFDIGFDYLVSTDHYGDFPPALDDDGIGQDDGWTTDPDNSQSGKDLLWISGAEVGWGEAHFNVIGGWRLNWQTGGDAWTNRDDIFFQVDDMRDPDRDGNIDAVVIINHPLCPGYIGWDIWKEIDKNYGKESIRASCIEVKNTSRYTGFDEDDLTGYDGIDYHLQVYAAHQVWDDMREIWGVGGDDCHHTGSPYQGNYPNATGLFGGFCTVVQTGSNSLTAEDLSASLDRGDCYVRENKTINSSFVSGPALAAISLNDNTITIELGSLCDVRWYKRGWLEIEDEEELGVATTSYIADGSEGYVVMEATDANGLKLWTQPFFIVEDIVLSYGANVTVSSGSGESNITDGNSNTSWDAGAGPSQWFKIDLGNVQQVNGIEILWGSADRWNYKIEYSLDDSTYYECNRLTYRNDEIRTFNIQDAEARYIKVTAVNYSHDNGGNVVVNECNIYSAPDMEDSVYYIDPENNSGIANNSNIGNTPDSPWLTLSNKKVRPRDKLVFISDFSGKINLACTVNLTDYHGRNNYARKIISGLYENNRAVVNANGETYGVYTNTNYMTIEYFRIIGGQRQLIIFDGGDGTGFGITAQYNEFISADDTTSTRCIEVSGISFEIFPTIKYNIIYSISNIHPVSGIVMTNCGGGKIYNNTVYTNKSPISIFDPIATGIYMVKNNIFQKLNSGTVYSDCLASHLDADYNCIRNTSEDGWYYAGNWTEGSNDIHSDPFFVDASSGDFKLMSKSPCKNRGLVVGIEEDFEGNSVPQGSEPDIGAYEYVEVPTGSGGGSGGGCFIATAVYGSSMAPNVIKLRKFRDKFLVSNFAGNFFLKTYYKYSPSIADAINKSDILKTIVRFCLIPLVLMGEICMNYGLKPICVFGILMLFVPGLIIARRKFRITFFTGEVENELYKFNADISH